MTGDECTLTVKGALGASGILTLGSASPNRRELVWLSAYARRLSIVRASALDKRAPHFVYRWGSKCGPMTNQSFVVGSGVLYLVQMKTTVPDCGKVFRSCVPVKTLDSLLALGCDGQRCTLRIV